MRVSFEDFDTLTDRLINIKSENWETSAYIKSTMKKYIRADKDFSTQSLVLLWFDAKRNSSFEKFQDIGDWVLFTSVLFPGTIRCDMEFYQSIGRLTTNAIIFCVGPGLFTKSLRTTFKTLFAK